MACFRRVPLSTEPVLVDYESLLGQQCVKDLFSLASEVQSRFGKGIRVWMLNSTSAGGGVAEMLPGLCRLLTQVGIPTAWLVMDGLSHDFHDTTKLLHYMLHGHDAVLPEAVLKKFQEESIAVSHELRSIISPHDILVVHDPQPLLAAVASRACTHVIWRCHIGSCQQNQFTDAAWCILEPSLREVQLIAMTSPEYLLPPSVVGTVPIDLIHPSIDPFSEKNKLVCPDVLLPELRRFGLIPNNSGDGQSPSVQVWKRYTGNGTWTCSAIKGIAEGRPVILQVSRFDQLKGYPQVLASFPRLDRSKRPILLLAGQDPGLIADDPDAARVLEQLCADYDRLYASDPLGCDVHILRLAIDDRVVNAQLVNALQSLASVVVQNSLQEGFGLVVTEAMWKAKAVVVAPAVGLRAQVEHSVSGLISKSSDPADLAAEINTLLRDPELCCRLGKAAHERYFMC